MFRKGLIVLAVALALITASWVTAQSGTVKTAVTSNVTHTDDSYFTDGNILGVNVAPNASPAALPRPKGYAAWKEAQLEQMDAAQLGMTVPAFSYENAARESLDELLRQRRELRQQRLLDPNEIFYPSPTSEPMFWGGRPY